MDVQAPLDFDSVRAQFELTEDFPIEVEQQAAAASDRFANDRVDATDIPLVTIDPVGSLDLDQAVHIARTDDGFLLTYAIADLGALIKPGSPLDLEARKRGQTIYLPDGTIPLHPRILSESIASLVAGENRPCVLWQVATDAAGHLTQARVSRAIVRVRERLDYPTLQAAFDAGDALPDAVALLPEWGELRRQRARERGAIELQLPEQDLERDGESWRLRLEPRTQMDAWNAECSLATGIAAARMMLAANVGILRTLPAPDATTVETFRAASRALGASVADDATPGQILAALEPDSPASLALNAAATKLLRGANYEAFAGAAPEHDWHAGVATEYTHATAPIRRLVDRFSNEVCLAVTKGEWVPVPNRSENGVEDAHARSASNLVDPEILAALPELPAIMRESGHLASNVENAAINFAEAVTLEHRIGERFTAALLRPSDETHDAEIFVLDPPVIAQCRGELIRGVPNTVRLAEVNVAKRRVRFEAVAAGEQ